jgi:Transposase domain (DUF772)
LTTWICGLGFEGVVAETTGRPAYHPATMLKIYVYGYVKQIQSSRLLERETARNVEMMWLTGRLTPDFKKIADFRKDNGPATGVGRGISFASFLKFGAVAANKNSSLAPLGPRRRNRSSLRMRFR